MTRLPGRVGLESLPDGNPGLPRTLMRPLLEALADGAERPLFAS